MSGERDPERSGCQKMSCERWNGNMAAHMLCSGDFGILKNKRSNVKFAAKVDWRPVVQYGHQVYHIFSFSPKNHAHYLYFRWRNSITGWTISKISTSFHHALMAIGMYAEAQWEIPTGNWDKLIQEKRRVCRLCTRPPRCSRVNNTPIRYQYSICIPKILNSSSSALWAPCFEAERQSNRLKPPLFESLLLQRVNSMNSIITDCK